MNKKNAKRLWEDTLLHGPQTKTFTRLNITKDQAEIFLSHTMPEMFVDDETNRIHLLRIKELKQEEKKLFTTLKKKQSTDLALTIGLFCYTVLVLPTLVLIAYIKYAP